MRTKEADGPAAPRQKSACTLGVRAERVLNSTDKGADQARLQAYGRGVLDGRLVLKCGSVYRLR